MVPTTTANTFGAALIGIVASAFTFGILTMQCLIYYRSYPEDRRFYKILVAVLWLLEVAHSFCSFHFLYHYGVVDQGNVVKVAVERIIWSLAVQVILSAIVGTIVKLCFAMRAYRFSQGNVWITSALVLSTLVQLGFSIWFTIAGVRLPSLLQLNSIFTVAIAALGLGVLTDVLTASVITWYLWKIKSGYRKSDTLVDKLIAYAVNTGLLTSVFSIACLITYGTMPNNFIFISLFFVLSKLYANSLLATLNTRLEVHGRGAETGEPTIPTFLMEDVDNGGGTTSKVEIVKPYSYV